MRYYFAVFLVHLALYTPPVQSKLLVNATFEPASINARHLNGQAGIPWGDNMNVSLTLSLIDGSHDRYQLLLAFECERAETCTLNNGEDIEVNLTKGEASTVQVELNALFIGRSRLVVKKSQVGDDEEVEVKLDKMEVRQRR